MRVENHAQQRAAPRVAAAIGEQRIISQECSHAYQNCIALVTLLLDVCARGPSGNPSAGRSSGRAVRARHWGRGDLAIERHRGFQGHQRNALANVTSEGLVQVAGFRFQSPNFHVNARRAHLLKASPTDFGIGIGHGSDHATNSGGDQSVGARGRAALVRVGLEIDVERASASLVAGPFEGDHFSVLHAIVGVNTRAHDAALRVDDHCANIRIGRRQSDALPREVERAVQEFLVSRVIGHH